MPYEIGPSGEMVEVKTAVAPMGISDWAGGMFQVQESYPGAWQSGVVLETSENLFRFSSVYACVSLISNDVAKLPARLQRQAADGVWDNVTSGSPFLPLLVRPNRYQNWSQFIQQWVMSKLSAGNAYVYLERDGRGGESNQVGVVRAMYVLDPRNVLPSEAPDGEVYYQVSSDELAQLQTRAVLSSAEIIHDRMMPIWHPLIGVSPLYASGVAATVGIRIQRSSETFFKNLSRPSGQLTAPGRISDELVLRLKTEFERRFSGDNVGRLFVSGEGLKYEAIAPPKSTDSQLSEQHEISVKDVAGAFHVPLYKIGAGQYPNLTSVGAMNQDYYDHAIQIHITGIEECLNWALGLGKLGLRVNLDEGGIMRMDPLARAEVTASEIKSATLSPNEGRLRENRHGVTGGESPYLQQQNYSLAALAKRDAKEDPFAKDQSAAAPTENPPEDDDEAADELASFAALRLRAALGMERRT